ncbi:uncharacterized protein LOC136095498 [Hydra vulgaris]|uniref:uncharacterized protein LOC136095498 n=1 Tax=Hydra vulgaris TaxID=6087 RepID=UPI0032EA5B4C
MGVTATLKSLSQAENKIIKSYRIKRFIYIPSIFGENKLCYDKNLHIFIEKDNEYFKNLNEHILSSMEVLKEHKRPVLVFFETKSTLMEFYNWSKLSINKDNIQIITEEVSKIPTERDMLIKRATISGQITFLTSVFGRGTDFVCSDKNVISNRGVHVVQTFFSKELSEEVQIQGRTARQGINTFFKRLVLN